MSSVMPLACSGARPSDRWIPWYFVAFFVGLTLVLGSFVWVALASYRGVVTEDAYKKGLAYNQTLLAVEKQTALGWTSDLALVPYGGKKVKIVFALRDAAGAVISDADVKIWFMRPTQAGMDQSFDVLPWSDGRYATEATLPARGVWEAHVSVRRGSDRYQMAQRVVLP